MVGEKALIMEGEEQKEKDIVRKEEREEAEK